MTDTTGHPDVAEISDLTDGLLPPSRSADVSRHLGECELCADVHASLEEIRELLGTLPGPPRMPDDVAQRIDAALAAEALLSAEAPETTDTAASVSRETSVADRPAGHARATTGPGRKGRTRGGRRKVGVLTAVLGAAALGIGSVLVSSLLGGGGGNSANGHTTAADTFSETRLEQQVADLLAKSGGTSSSQGVGVEGTDGRTKLLHQPTVPPCIQKGIGEQDAALAAEEGVYHGTNALLVVLPDTGDSTRITVYIVDTTCVTDPSAKAEVLLKDSYTRP